MVRNDRKWREDNGGIDMETIKEKAHLTAWQIFDETGLSHIELSKYSVDRMSEIIAEKLLEQKGIDIENACKWFDDYLFDIGYPDDWMRDSPNLKSGEDRFRKAMLEE